MSRALAQVGRRGEPVDVLAGGDVDPASGGLLSVAQLQAALRARTAAADTAPTAGPGVVVAGPPAHALVRPVWALSPRLVTDPDPGSGHPAAPGPVAPVWADPGAANRHPVQAPPADTGPALQLGWPAGRSGLVVAGAHAGAGASTVAVAVADAAGAGAGAAGSVQLVEWAAPGRSGLAAAAHRELGVDPDGAWRRGLRGPVTVIRRCGTEPDPPGWPDLDPPAGQLLIADVGVGRWWPGWGEHVVVVCRASVPGVAAAEQALAVLADPGRAVLAVVGPARWPGPVRANCGPLLRALLAGEQVVKVPVHRGLQVEGPTAQELPRPIAAAGRALLRLTRNSELRVETSR